MANYNSINEFKNNFFGGTRPNRFSVSATWPTTLNKAENINDQTKFKIIATVIPESTVEVITVPYRGRPINFAGDRKYSPWDITVYDDSETLNLWRVFQQWLEHIDGSANHKYIGASATNKDFSYKNHQKTFTLYQYDYNGEQTNAARTIVLHNAFPSSVGQIAMDMSENGLVTFPVQIMYDYLTFESNTINQ